MGAPPLLGLDEDRSWGSGGREVPSKHCLPEQGRDTPLAPGSTVGTRKPLAPKCQIVVFLYKKQN